jgi:carboxypeptidase C (cathepsin A)
MKEHFLIPFMVNLLILFPFDFLHSAPKTLIFAQEAGKSIAEPLPKAASKKAEKEIPEEKLSITRHVAEINGMTLKYTATAGRLQMKDDSGRIKSNIFFTAYVKDEQGDKPQRPITFAFNGGPGSSSIWLHLGALGPKRVLLTEEGKALPPPYRLVPNEYTWLDFTDLVLIDPVGTGYSYSVPGVDPKKFYGVREDIESVGEFIRLYVTRYKRWLSPKFIAGESYGTTRTAGLSGYLQNEVGMNLNGLFLISSVLNFQTISFTPGNDLPFILYLPSYACAAWYHKKLPAGLQADFPKTRMEVEHFALNDYLLALAKGDELTASERDKIIEKLSAYTGLSKAYIKNANLRIDRDDFVKELLGRENRRLGVLDSRITGSYKVEDFIEDPSVVEVSGPMVATWNDYVRTELKYETDLPYNVLSMKANQLWNWRSGTEEMGYVNVATTLQQAMSENKFLKVFIASGYYDLDTSYFATKYTANHLRLDRKLRDHITLSYYEAGHQMYTHLPSLKKLKADVAPFFQKASGNVPN